EALISVLEEKGVPSVVGRTLIRPPSSRMGPIDADERAAALAESPLFGRYDTVADRESAYEMLDAKAAHALRDAELAAREKQIAELAEAREKERAKAERRRSSRQTPMEAALNSFVRTVARQAGDSFVRGVLGSLTRGQ